MLNNTTYKDSGVDINLGNEFVKRIKPIVKSTFRPEVLTDLGGFGALFNINFKKYKEPLLVSTTDGVGTKLKIAFILDRHNSVGIDLVAMCVNDLIVQGAEPLFFLDYIATSKLDLNKAEDIIKGIAQGCQEAGCSLVGGETAEMPGFYSSNEYDLAGFAVGIVEKSKLVDGSHITPGNLIIGLESNGLHSNGYSLVRKLFLEKFDYDLNKTYFNLPHTLGVELLKPTRIYVKSILRLIESYEIKGIAHITGGGLTENIPRILPDGCQAVIDFNKWTPPAIFASISEMGRVSQEEMYKVFNMGVGLIMVIDEKDEKSILDDLQRLGEKGFLIGRIEAGESGVSYIS
ncbi:MAG: phosphoribosylformylglycinamidine cyclo-ligase [bacterium]